jgi:hypothetical protein
MNFQARHASSATCKSTLLHSVLIHRRCQLCGAAASAFSSEHLTSSSSSKDVLFQVDTFDRFPSAVAPPRRIDVMLPPSEWQETVAM